MVFKICPHCKQEFIRAHNRQIYCSRYCNRKSDKYQEMRRRYENSEQGKATAKAYAEKRKVKQIIKNCLICGKEFLPLKSHKNYCSIKCYHRSDRYKQVDKKRNQNSKRIKDNKKRAQTTEYKKKKLAYQRTEKFKAYNRKRQKFKRMTDPIFRIKQRIKARLGAFVRASNIKKTNSTFVMVGCTPEFLKEYLEKKFKPGMTWDNHSLDNWHIDHIIPLDSAKNEDDLKRLSHYTNLQPMWAKDNIKKSNKLIYES